LEFFRRIGVEGESKEQTWHEKFEAYRREYPALAAEFERRCQGKLTEDWEAGLPVFEQDSKGMSTRVASGKTINSLAKVIPELIGGSADLAPSNNSWINEEKAFQKDTPGGRNFHFGVREHAMGSIVNGMAVHGGVIPYGATFLVFSDYMRPAIRLSAISHYPSIWIFTHDSIGVGEDGPTHQPVEQIASLRAIPNLLVLRPADANEVTQAWRVALHRRDGPSAFILTRQNLPIFNRNMVAPAEGLRRGAYVLADIGGSKPDAILMASGSEVSLIYEAGKLLAEGGLKIRVVSFPSWELFTAQSIAYQKSVLPPSIRARIAVEAGISLGWERWVGDRGKIIAVDRYGASAPYKTIFEHYGLTIEAIISAVKSIVS
jgi:transketolase